MEAGQGVFIAADGTQTDVNPNPVSGTSASGTATAPLPPPTAKTTDTAAGKGSKHPEPSRAMAALSRATIIALGVGLGVGAPVLVVVFFTFRFVIPRRRASGKDNVEPLQTNALEGQGQIRQHFGRLELPAESVRAKDVVYERRELPVSEDSDPLRGRAELR
ncbi:MAG: hypothetical protein Q9160_007066 [Pyrenula sp. 1 TL-2023]